MQFFSLSNFKLPNVKIENDRIRWTGTKFGHFILTFAMVKMNYWCLLSFSPIFYNYIMTTRLNNKGGK